MHTIGYLDPGSGAMIGGMIAGVGAAVAVAAKSGGYKIARLVSPKKRREEKEAKAHADAETAAATSEPEVPSEEVQ